MWNLPLNCSCFNVMHVYIKHSRHCSCLDLDTPPKVVSENVSFKLMFRHIGLKKEKNIHRQTVTELK